MISIAFNCRYPKKSNAPFRNRNRERNEFRGTSVLGDCEWSKSSVDSAATMSTTTPSPSAVVWNDRGFFVPGARCDAVDWLLLFPIVFSRKQPQKNSVNDKMQHVNKQNSILSKVTVNWINFWLQQITWPLLMKLMQARNLSCSICQGSGRNTVSSSASLRIHTHLCHHQQKILCQLLTRLFSLTGKLTKSK